MMQIIVAALGIPSILAVIAVAYNHIWNTLEGK